jgi:hypothetical protein
MHEHWRRPKARPPTRACDGCSLGAMTEAGSGSGLEMISGRGCRSSATSNLRFLRHSVSDMAKGPPARKRQRPRPCSGRDTGAAAGAAPADRNSRPLDGAWRPIAQPHRNPACAGGVNRPSGDRRWRSRGHATVPDGGQGQWARSSARLRRRNGLHEDSSPQLAVFAPAPVDAGDHNVFVPI